MLKTQICYSTQVNSFEAAREAAAGAIGLLGETPDLLFIMTTWEVEHQAALDGIREAAPGIMSVGCPADAIILREGLFNKSCVAVMAIKGSGCTITVDLEETLVEENKAVSPVPDKAGAALGGRIFEKLMANQRPGESHNMLILLSDNRLNEDVITKNISNILGPLCPVIGTAVHGWEMCGPFLNGKIMNKHSIGILITSEEPNGIGVSHGWKPYGPASVATKVSDSRIYELNGHPAFDEYRKMWGDQFPDVEGKSFAEMKESFYTFAVYHPLGLPMARGEYLVRDPYHLNDDRSFLCGGTIPANSVVHVMTGSKENLLGATKQAAIHACKDIKQQPGGILFFDCITRLSLPDFDITQELKVITDLVDDTVPILGMLSRGEIATPQSGVVLFHNKTLAIAAFS